VALVAFNGATAVQRWRSVRSSRTGLSQRDNRYLPETEMRPRAFRTSLFKFAEPNPKALSDPLSLHQTANGSGQEFVLRKRIVQLR
jgi:hypothetical protein